MALADVIIVVSVVVQHSSSDRGMRWLVCISMWLLFFNHTVLCGLKNSNHMLIIIKYFSHHTCHCLVYDVTGVGS